MREYLFRGKSTDSGKWLYGDLNHYAGGMQMWVTDADGGTWNYLINPETIGEFTGSHDKNGVKIFEGDILRDTRTGKVKFVRYENNRFLLVDRERFYDYSGWDDYEIIGNIWDNPEIFNTENNCIG